jgi:membrane fusion protein (multidrug efflux system)
MKPPYSRGALLATLVVSLVGGACWRGFPHVRYALNHVSTDDATVNSHVTYVGSRVASVVERVLVEENQYVAVGDPLFHLDATPFQLVVAARRASLARARLAVDQSVAGLAVADAELEQAKNQVRTQIAGLAASWYLVAAVQDFVKYGVATLRSDVATLEQKRANYQLARIEAGRYARLGTRGVTQEAIDQHRVAMEVAEHEVHSAAQTAQRSRALLGLGSDEGAPGGVPAKLGESFNGTQYALAVCSQLLTQLGVNLDVRTIPLGELRARLFSMVVDRVVDGCPAVVAARARLGQARAALGAEGASNREHHPAIVQAQKELEQAELELSYTNVRAPVAGFVSQRSVNPGAHVAVGQNMLAIRPLGDVWVEANFKETQLSSLCIGQAVDLSVDAYPDRLFHGRVSGFSPGTGAVSSLLPAENATGNFVKVVQRLPVRIELVGPVPMDTPLFAGLSVVPEVDIVSPPTGPDAGTRLAGVRGKYTNFGKAAIP